ncbi:putative monooxygenase [Xylariaceae sp. AK1471]|nr:putative monooxygenase [Xylariaceae sp. AK1471]
METPGSFRVIIVGGGLVGLSAAHALWKAGINFALLEKHDTPLSSQGTTLAFWPQTFRIFNQLGLFDAVQPLLSQINRAPVISPKDAKIIMEDDTLNLVERNHGYGIRVAHRPDIVKFLYESLPETVRSHILLKKNVVDIAVLDDGVEVYCSDGTTHEGSLVIGADGVRSKARLLMQALRSCKPPENLTEVQKNPYTTTYRMYYGTIPPLPGLASNTRYDGARDDLSTQIVNGTDRAWFGLYEKLESPTSEHKRYTEEEKTQLLEKWGYLYMAPGWTFRDVNTNRIGNAGYIDLEEGLVERWFNKRIVLVGDAVRKLEPHAGLGYNCGVTDLVVLVNGLRRLLQQDGSPSTHALEKLFSAYQTRRKKATQKTAEISKRAARLLAWPTWKYRLVAKYALPYLPLNKMNANIIFSPLISEAPVFEWLDERALPPSRIPWMYDPGSQGKE